MPTWVETYLTSANPYFYPVVGFSLLLAGLGMPISADLVLLTVGYLAYQGQADYIVLIPVCIGSILASDTGMYFIGKHCSKGVGHVWPFKKIFTPDRLTTAETSFTRYGYRVVFLARFMPGIRTIFMFTSGLLRLRYLKFILHDLAGALIVVPGTIYSVKWVAGNLDLIQGRMQRGQWYFLGLFLLVVLVLGFRRARRVARASLETR